MRSLLLASGLMIAACSTTPTGHGANGAEDAVWTPLLPATLGATRSSDQRLHAFYADQDIALDCVVSVTPRRITVVGLLPLGQRLFTIEYAGSKVSLQTSAAVPSQFRAEYLLMDLQLALWPLPALEQALRGSPWQISEPQPFTRRLLHRNRLFAEVHYTSADPWSGRLWLVNFERRYSLSIESRPME